MPLAQKRRQTGISQLVRVVVLCVGTSALVGCGASSAPRASAQRAHATVAQSSPDVGAAHVQTFTAQRSRVRSTDAEPRVAQVHGNHGVLTAQPGAVRVEKARPVPETSKDDSKSVVAIGVDPCTLVSVSEAEAITGGPIARRVEAPLGPTCIYRRGGSKGDITLAVESISISQVTRQMPKQSSPVMVRRHRGYCVKLGAQMLFIPLSKGHLLNVAAPCAIARRFAAVALGRLAA
jgi:hypothetical protein